ncbi:hypothetical protein E8E11_003841 [Didymella keratinophila]|nr:hypothetical protein E8E11_003841 [Didymella keratinophila]
MPLPGRAWLFQERQLSKRIVHFGIEEMWWECSSMTTCECVRAPHLCDSKEKYLRTPRVPLNGKANWHTIVTEYTKLGLTYKTDIFPALQGIASTIGETGLDGYVRVGHAKDGYSADLWKSAFLEDLIWWCSDELNPNGYEREPLKPDYVALSWLWASGTGFVNWWETDANYEPMVDRVEVRTMPKGDDELGEISAGYVELDAACLALDSGELSFQSDRSFTSNAQVLL